MTTLTMFRTPDSTHWSSKVLMDGGSGLNILYANTLELLEIDRLRLRGNIAPFHGIVPGKRT